MPVYYAVTNPSIRAEDGNTKLVKFGRSQDVFTLPERIRNLQTTAVPRPFSCIYAVQPSSKDEKDYERLIHKALRKLRDSENREFFLIERDEAIAIMRLIPGRDVTSKAKVTKTKSKEKATDETVQKKKEKRPNFKFSYAQVPMGATLTFKGDDSKTAKVMSENTVEFRGKEMTTSGSAAEIQKEKGLSPKVAGTAYWMYEGETLYERRLQIEDKQK